MNSYIRLSSIAQEKKGIAIIILDQEELIRMNTLEW